MTSVGHLMDSKYDVLISSVVCNNEVYKTSYYYSISIGCYIQQNIGGHHI